MKTRKRLKRIALVMALLGTGLAIYVWFFVYNKPHPDYEELKAEYHFRSEVLFSEYRESKRSTDAKYTGKMVSLSGSFKYIETINDQTIVVFVFDTGIFGDEGIRCVMLENYEEIAHGLSPGTEVKVKGFCSGYNETDVILDKCTINKL